MHVAILLLPLLGALIAGFGARAFGERVASGLAALAVATAAVLCWIALLDDPEGRPAVTLARWLSSGDLEVYWAIRTDRLSLTMAAFIASLAAVIQTAVIGFRVAGDDGDDDPDRARLAAYTALLTFMMLLMVTGDSLLQVFAGWEGAMAVTYLLTAFWYKRLRADRAATRVFVMNRIGQAAMILALVVIFAATGSLQADIVLDQMRSPEFAAASIAGFAAPPLIAGLLGVALAARAGMVFFHTWPAAAGDAPAPALALILGTVLGGGVFLVCRVAPLFAEAGSVHQVLILFAAASAVIGAAVAIAQSDALRALGFIAASQASLTVAGALAGAFQGAVLHMIGGGLALAILVLSVGLAIQASGGERAVGKMGGLRHQMPFTCAMMVLGILALAGFGIPLSGIGLAGHGALEGLTGALYGGTGAAAGLALLLAVLAMTLVVCAAVRLLVLIFLGNAASQAEPFQSSGTGDKAVVGALSALALGTLLTGAVWSGALIGGGADAWWIGSLPAMAVTEVPIWVSLAPMAALVAGAGIAFLRYGSGPGRAARDTSIGILATGLHWDDTVDKAIAQPAQAAGQTAWRRVDGSLIDGAIAYLGPAHVPWLTGLAQRMQSGFLYQYALVLLAGLVVVLAWLTVGGES